MYENGNIQAWLTMANAYDEREEYDKAIEQLNYALQFDDKNPDVYHLLGYIYAEKQDYKRALDFMNRTLELDPEHEEAIGDIEIIKEAMA